MKIKGYEVLWFSEDFNVVLVYAQFDVSEKYKILRKVKYKCEDGTCNDVWEFYNAFGTQGEAVRYAKQMLDREVER